MRIYGIMRPDAVGKWKFKRSSGNQKRKKKAKPVTSERMRAWGPGGKAPWRVQGRSPAGVVGQSPTSETESSERNQPGRESGSGECGRELRFRRPGWSSVAARYSEGLCPICTNLRSLSSVKVVSFCVFQLEDL